MMGMAMSEAAKVPFHPDPGRVADPALPQLFDQSGGAASGTKQDAVTSAGQMVMKLMMKQQMSGVSLPLHRFESLADTGADDGRRELGWTELAYGDGEPLHLDLSIGADKGQASKFM